MGYYCHALFKTCKVILKDGYELLEPPPPPPPATTITTTTPTLPMNTSLCMLRGACIFQAAAPCQCDLACTGYKDCCSDFDSTCSSGTITTTTTRTRRPTTSTPRRPTTTPSSSSSTPPSSSSSTSTAGDSDVNTSPVPISTSPPPSSCVELGCNGGYNPSAPCQCDVQCFNHGDCCQGQLIFLVSFLPVLLICTRVLHNRNFLFFNLFFPLYEQTSPPCAKSACRRQLHRHRLRSQTLQNAASAAARHTCPMPTASVTRSDKRGRLSTCLKRSALSL